MGYSDEDGRRPKLSLFTAMYTPEEGICYAMSAKYAILERLERRPQAMERSTALRRLAERSTWRRELGSKPPREVVLEDRARAGVRTADATVGTPSSRAGG